MSYNKESQPMHKLTKLLETYRKESLSEKEKGYRFERFIKAFLEKEPRFNHFSRIWLWSDFPHNGGQPDTGIDLVAEDNMNGGYCAIQCKFYKEDYKIQKADIDSFMAISGKEGFTSRLIVSTVNSWSKNAEEAIDNQQISVTRLGLNQLYNSAIDWSIWDKNSPENLNLKPKKQLRPHQERALEDIRAGFLESDRGKLIMACGTGKTFTSLKVAEDLTPHPSRILFLVPSLSLMAQSIRDWINDSERKLDCIAVCSDTKVSHTQDSEDINPHDMPIPVTTKAKRIVNYASQRQKAYQSGDDNMLVIFSTYQSIKAIYEAQKLGLGEFDLVICDEAHRTTGVKWKKDEDDSHFIRIHNQNYIAAKKRLYMTATPRIYSEKSRSKADESGVLLCSMDDEKLYGKTLHHLGFDEAVEANLLSDYKVIILGIDEEHISQNMQSGLSAQDGFLNMQNAAQIVGSWQALSKQFDAESLSKLAIGEDIKPENINKQNADLAPMRRAVAFCSNIQNSKDLRDNYNHALNDYLPYYTKENLLTCEFEHIDGRMNAMEKEAKLNWLKEEPFIDENTPNAPPVCRVLSNVRCLSEGVDVPSLDGVIFFNSRSSVVDIIQAVGRVMRKAEGKKYGYIIIPVAIPPHMSAHESFNNRPEYKTIWQVLQALRAHDNRLMNDINKINLGGDPKALLVSRIGSKNQNNSHKNQRTKDSDETSQPMLPVIDWDKFHEYKEALYAQIVKKCGSRTYWEDWAKDIATIATRHITRITHILEASPKAEEEFNHFIESLHSNINNEINRDDAIEMLAQHMITQPVFNAIFEDYDFSAHNPVSQSMQKMANLLEDYALEKERQPLDRFYKNVKARVSGIDNMEGKQKIIIELYDHFFKKAFPHAAERLGIVYTPLEVVDFIIHSVEYALNTEFSSCLNHQNVQILDPFTGTGTFIVRLLQSGLIRPENLPYKYHNEIFANEIVLLAYYIASINMENAFHHIMHAYHQGKDYPKTPENQKLKPRYEAFEGITLTDTFNMFENDNTTLAKMLPENNKRLIKQKQAPIKVIMGNPPYSSGQRSENDNNKNTDYPRLNSRIKETYVQHSTASNKNSLYDSYIQAIRWASDRIEEEGIIAYVSNGSFIDGNAMDGFRKSVMDEFNAIYCFNLRGFIRGQSGEKSKKEGQNIFNILTGVAITLFIKNPHLKENTPCQLYYYDIGDYLDRKSKLKIIEKFKHMGHIPWQNIIPNEKHDWINQRNDKLYESFTILGDKKDKTQPKIFKNYSRGLETGRDAWAVNYSQEKTAQNMDKMIDFYNRQVDLLIQKQKEMPSIKLEDALSNDETKIKWCSTLKKYSLKKILGEYYQKNIRLTFYRPYCKQYSYHDKVFCHRLYQLPHIFPEKDTKNLVISVTGRGSKKEFSALIMNITPDLETISKGQAFPLYTYEKIANEGEIKDDLFSHEEGEIINGYRRRDNITDESLKAYQNIYKDENINKEDIFYYIYGILHSPAYKQDYAQHLSREIPRIPYVKDFWGFSKAGRKLAHLHLHYEDLAPYPSPVQEVINIDDLDNLKLYQIEKMRFAKININGKSVNDKRKIIYNAHISLENIPPKAYDYVVNGRPAIEWIMDRYQVRIDKASGIINDPNTYSKDKQYIFNLLKKIIRLSLKSVDIIEELPKLEIIKKQS